MNKYFLSLHKLSKSFKDGYEKISVLKNININFEDNKIVSLVGPSGSGKSTLLHLLALLDSPDAGKIIFNNKDLVKSNDEEKTTLRKNDIAIVYQNNNLISDLSAIENIALAYLNKRSISIQDIQKYNIGYCKTGRYRNRIIVPSYDKNGNINYFIARSFEPDPFRKYDAPTCNKTELIGLEYFVNWSIPVILCEGIFDAIAIKRNAIPLFGKTIPKSLMMKLVESEIKTVYLALDKDALKEALDYSQNLLNLGKEVYLIELEGKDPSDLGFNNMTKLLHTAKPLSFGDLLLKKIQLI